MLISFNAIASADELPKFSDISIVDKSGGSQIHSVLVKFLDNVSTVSFNRELSVIPGRHGWHISPGKDSEPAFPSKANFFDNGLCTIHKEAESLDDTIKEGTTLQVQSKALLDLNPHLLQTHQYASVYFSLSRGVNIKCFINTDHNTIIREGYSVPYLRPETPIKVIEALFDNVISIEI